MDDSNSIIHEPCATQAESQLQNSNADDDDAGSDASEQHAGERRQRCRGKNKIQPVVEGGLQRFICPLCKTGFDQQHQLTMHIRAHNSGGTAVNQCTLCGKQLSSQSSLDRHMLVHSGERPFCCRICAMSFTTNGNMHRHMAVHEKDMPAEWKAMMSEKRRRRKSAKLAKSDASATSTSVESGCSSAPAEPGAGQAAAFANLNAMWLSQVPFLETLSKFLTPLPASTTHSEADADADADANADADSDSDQMTDMPEADDVKSISTPHEHQGSVNSQQDATNENLDDVDVDVKMVNVEDTNDDRPRLRIVSESESGPNSFAESSNLNSLNPEESAAPQTERSGAQKPRKCRFCTLTFPTVNALRLHVRSHHGLSPFRCQVCEYTSVDKSTLVRHMRTHNGQRPFRCTECGYAFTTKANCERHVKTRHQKTTKQELLGAVAIVSAAQSPSSQSCQSHSTSASAGSSCRFLCCRKRMSSWRLVNRHVRMRHAKRKTLFTAAKPPLEFATTQALSTGSDQDTKVDVDVEVDDIKHEAEPTEQLQLAVNCVQNAPLVASAFDYASWFNLVGAFHKLAATNLPTVDCDVRCDDYSEQTEPLDLTVKPHAEAHAGNNSLSVGIGFGAPQYDSGFSSAKTLSPDGPFEMRTDAGAPLGSLALLAFYQNVLAASNQFALTSASQCAPSASAFTTARSLDGGTLIDAHSHSHSHNEFDYSAESLRSDENETRDERPDSQNDVELDVCDNDQSGAGARAEADSLAKQDDDGDGDGDGDGNAQHSYSQSDASCAQQTADEALSETEVGASKKKRNSYSDSPRRIQCPYCTRSFPWISSLKRHLITHTGQKPFRCPRCSLNFSTKSNRERHLQRKHGVKVHGSSGSLNVTIGKSDERTNESALTATNLSGSTATLEDNELHDMTVADSIADAIGENLLKNASLVMSPNVSRTGARKSNDDVKLVLDVRQCRRADNKKCDTPTRS